MMNPRCLCWGTRCVHARCRPTPSSPPAREKRIANGSPRATRRSSSSRESRRTDDRIESPRRAPRLRAWRSSSSAGGNPISGATFQERNAHRVGAGQVSPLMDDVSSQSRPSQRSPQRCLCALCRAASTTVVLDAQQECPAMLPRIQQVSNAVRAPPTWRKPVGEGAKRSRGVLIVRRRGARRAPPARSRLKH